MGDSTSPFLFVGLGNPGAQYERTPHNLGFEAMERLARALGGATEARAKFESLYSEHTVAGRKVFCIQPQTYMNLSGNAVREFVRFYKCAPETDLLVVTDDLDLPPGRLRLRMNGGSGGHNGLNSIIAQLGTENFPRLRIGVGRHPHMPSERYLLSKIPKGDWPVYEPALDRAVDGMQRVLAEGVPKAMNFCNQKDAEEKSP